MNLLLSTGSVHHLAPETAFWLAHMATFDGVEVIIDSRMVEVGAGGIAEYAERYQAPVRGIHAPFVRIAEWGGFWEGTRHALEWARDLGTPLLVVHPFAPIRIEWIGRRHKVFARRLEGLRDAAAAHEITVALENLPRSRNPLIRLVQSLDSLDAVASLARRTGVKVAFDTSHLGTWGAAIVSAFDGVKDLVVDLHLSDYAPGQQHLLPKRGGLPLAGLLTAAHQAGYAGPITLEVCPKALGDGAMDQVLTLLIKARKWLKRHAG